MRGCILVSLLFALTACAPESGKGPGGARGEVDIEALALKCAEDHKSAGFDSSSACFAYLITLLENGR